MSLYNVVPTHITHIRFNINMPCTHKQETVQETTRYAGGNQKSKNPKPF